MASHIVAALALAALAAGSTAAPACAGELVNRGVLPDGHPAMVVDGITTTSFDMPRRPLQFAVIDGKRVLIDPDSREVVYRLRP